MVKVKGKGKKSDVVVAETVELYGEFLEEAVEIPKEITEILTMDVTETPEETVETLEKIIELLTVDETEYIDTKEDIEILTVDVIETVEKKENTPLRDDRGAEVIRKALDSRLGSPNSGSMHLGMRLYKTGEYAANRIWHAMQNGSPVFVCQTENIGKGNWAATDALGIQHTGRSRTEVINASVSAFLKATAEDSTPEE